MIDVEAAEEFRLTYPDGPHDAEAMFVDFAMGDLFIVTIKAGAWPVNEVVRISGPFDEFGVQR